jgi:hypothetical protein
VIRVVFDVKGDILTDLQNLQSASKPAAKAVFQRFVDRVVPKARALAPDDPETGGVDLKASIRGRVTVRTSGMVTASVIAGGNPLLPLLSQHRKNPARATSYAIVQHEDPTLHHRHGQANFVGQPFMAEAQAIGDDLDKEILSRAR